MLEKRGEERGGIIFTMVVETAKKGAGITFTMVVKGAEKSARFSVPLTLEESCDDVSNNFSSS